MKRIKETEDKERIVKINYELLDSGDLSLVKHFIETNLEHLKTIFL